METTKTAGRFELLPFFTVLFFLGLKFSTLMPANLYVIFLFVAIASVLVTRENFIDKKWAGTILTIGALSSGIFTGMVQIKPDISQLDLFKFDQSKGVLTGQFKGEFRLLKSGGTTFKMSNPILETASQAISLNRNIVCTVKAGAVYPEPEQYYSATGILICDPAEDTPRFKADKIIPVSSPVSPTAIAGSLQRKIRDTLMSILPMRHASLMIGFLLGDTSRIKREDRILFRETGLNHIMAVSGQHIMILAFFLASILHWLKVPPVSRSLLIIAVLAGYAMITTGSPSVWRALIMYCCLAVVLHTEARPGPFHALSAAALILLIYSPESINHVGFQLSFTAVLAILILRHPIEDFLKCLRLPTFLRRYIAVILAANLGVLPMSAFLFGTISVSALFVNILTGWIFMFILPVGFIATFSAIISPNIGLFIAPGISIALDGLLTFLEKVQSIPGGFFYVGNVPGLLCAFIYLFLFYLAATWNKKRENLLIAQAASREIPNEKPIIKVTRISDLPAKEVPQVILEESFSKNPFRERDSVDTIDYYMKSFRNRSLKSSPSNEQQHPIVNLLGIDNQTILHRLQDLDRMVFEEQPERLIQASVFLLSIMSSEFISRIIYFLDPPPAPEELEIALEVKSRHLDNILVADTIFNSPILTRIDNKDMIMTLSQGQILFNRGRNQIMRTIKNYKGEYIEQHLLLRKDILEWTKKFIENFSKNGKLSI